MIIIHQYQLEEIEAGYIRVVSCENSFCPVCGHVVIVIGTRDRKVIKDDGMKQKLIIRRLRCKNCWTIHHELPDILIPYKRHCAKTVEKIIDGDTSDVCCEGRTIQRIKMWWAACSLYFESIIISLREKYGAVFSQSPAPKEIVRAVANANLWVHTRSAYLSG